MGGGNTAPKPPAKIGGISGQGGGRKMPAVATSIGELVLGTMRLTPPYGVVTSKPDLRPTKPSSLFDTVWTGRGGGSGQAGTGNNLEIYWEYNSTGASNPIFASAGGGGGWGAAGGTAQSSGVQYGVASPIRNGILGAAGGKAIQTNGQAVTWLSGANRAYGAIG